MPHYRYGFCVAMTGSPFDGIHLDKVESDVNKTVSNGLPVDFHQMMGDAAYTLRYSRLFHPIADEDWGKHWVMYTNVRYTIKIGA